jgi:hypothetical protein
VINKKETIVKEMSREVLKQRIRELTNEYELM